MLPNDVARCMGLRCDVRESCARHHAHLADVAAPTFSNAFAAWIDPDRQGADCAERIPVESDDD